MPFREIITACSDNYSKYMNALFGYWSGRFLILKQLVTAITTALKNVKQCAVTSFTVGL